MLKRALIVVLALNASLLAQGEPHQRPPQQPFPEAVRPFLKEYQEKMQARDINGALEALGKAIAAAPAEKRLWYTRGDILIKLRRWTEAVADLTKVIELDGAMSLAWRLRGFARQQLKEMENAGKDFTKVVELAPGSADSYLYRASLRSMTGELEGALQDYNKVTELAAEWGPGYLSRAEVSSALGKYKEAMEDYDNAMFLLEGAAQAGVLMNRARTKFHMGDAEGAAKDAAAAIQTAPGHERHFSRGLLRHDMGDYKGCIEDMRKAIEERKRPTDARAEPRGALVHRRLATRQGRQGIGEEKHRGRPQDPDPPVHRVPERGGRGGAPGEGITAAKASRPRPSRRSSGSCRRRRAGWPPAPRAGRRPRPASPSRPRP